VRVGAAPTKPGRVSTARWRGSGERGGKEYARNQRDYVPQRLTGSNLADMGRKRCAPGGLDREDPGWWGTPGWSCGCLPGGHGEVLRGSRGDAAGIELGSSSVERSAVNTGTVPVLSPFCATSAGVVG
jgi:hypothetical protein